MDAVAAIERRIPGKSLHGALVADKEQPLTAGQFFNAGRGALGQTANGF